MEILEILTFFSIFPVLVDIIQTRRGKSTRVEVLGFSLPYYAITSNIVVLCYLVYLYSFVVGDFRVAEAFYYSNSHMTLSERVYASWASNAGSWIFFSAMFALGYLVIRSRLGEREEYSDAYQALNLVLLFMVFILNIKHPLSTLSYTPPEGMGLNPLLKTWWMLVHPPIVFLGYTLTLYAFSFVFIRTPAKDGWVRFMSAVSWLFLTLGIAFGGLWAYEVLGWGGYWAWDPVETSSLLPWLTLTAYFHLASSLAGEKSHSRDFMVMVSGALIILASAITRGGLTVSVHAFGRSPVGYVLLILDAVLIGFFLVSKSRKGWSYFQFEAKADTPYNAGLTLSFLSLVLITLVSTWGILFPIINSGLTGAEVSLEPEFFNKWNYPFVLLFLVGLVGCHLHEWLDERGYTGLVAAATLVGVGAVVVGVPTRNTFVNFGLPFAVLAAAATIMGLGSSLLKGRSIQASRALLHLGVAVIMVGVFLSSAWEVNYGELTGSNCCVLELGELELKFGEFEVVGPAGQVVIDANTGATAPEYVGFKVPVTVRSGGVVHQGESEIYLYTRHGIVSRPTIIRGLSYDVYVVLHQSMEVYRALAHQSQGIPLYPQSFVVSVRYIPLLNLVWMGVALMCLGIIYPASKTRPRAA